MSESNDNWAQAKYSIESFLCPKIVTINTNDNS